MYFQTYVQVCVLFAALSTLSKAAPLDVFVPPILYPHAGTVWIAGNHHNVTWDTSNAPQNITNPTGTIELVTNGIITGPTLASGFNILDGRVVVQVPNVAPGDHQLVLFGDSGNDSPVFQITD